MILLKPEFLTVQVLKDITIEGKRQTFLIEIYYSKSNCSDQQEKLVIKVEILRNMSRIGRNLSNGN